MITYTSACTCMGSPSTWTLWVDRSPPPIVAAFAALDVIAALAHLAMIRSLAGAPLDPPPPVDRSPAPSKATTWLARRRARR